MNVKGSARTIEFSCNDRNSSLEALLKSPEYCYIIVKEFTWKVHLFDTTTGEHLSSDDGTRPGHWITPDGRNFGCIVCGSENKGMLLEITIPGELVGGDEAVRVSI